MSKAEASEEAMEKYGTVVDLILAFRSMSNINSYKKNAEKLWKALEILPSDKCNMAELDAVLIGIFKKYFYEKNATAKSDAYFTCILNGLGFLDGYYRHFLTPDGELEKFYSTKNRAFHFLQDSDYLERFPIPKKPENSNRSQKIGKNSQNKGHVSEEEFKKFRGYCGDKGKLVNILDAVLQSFPDVARRNEDFYQKECIKEYTENGRLKLPHYPDLFDKSKRGDPSSNEPQRNRPGPQFAAKRGAIKDVSLDKHFNVKQRPDYCIGRDELLTAIRDEFTTSGSIQILYGTAGVGKTTVAGEYAFRYRKDYRIVWWIKADNGSDMTKNCKAFLRACGVPEDKLQNPEEDFGRLFREYFHGIDDSWLLIFDNADYLDNSDENGKVQDLLTSYLPESSPNGHILITSRCNVDFMAAKRRKLSMLTEEQALEYLQKLTGQKEPVEDAKAVAKKLGYLPLALRYAGAYMKSSNESYSGYLELWDEYGPKVLDEELDEVIEYRNTVRAAFQITINKLKSSMQSRKNKLIADAVWEFLNICAYTAPDNISLIPYREARNLPDSLGSVLRNKLDLNTFKRELVKYSLFDKTGDQTYSIHRLLQEIIRDGHAKDKNNPTEDEKKETRKWISYSWSALQLESLENAGDIHRPYDFTYDFIKSLIPNILTVLRWNALYARNEKEAEQFCSEYESWCRYYPKTVNDFALEKYNNDDIIVRSCFEADYSQHVMLPYLHDLLDLVYLVPYGKLTNCAVRCANMIALRYKYMGEIERAAQYFNTTIKLVIDKYEKYLNSTIEDFSLIVWTGFIFFDSIYENFRLGSVIIQSDLDYYADTILQVAEKLIREDKINANRSFPSRPVNTILFYFIWAYRLKFQFCEMPEKENVRVLKERMLENEDQKSMRMVILNVANYIDKHHGIRIKKASASPKPGEIGLEIVAYQDYVRDNSKPE